MTGDLFPDTINEDPNRRYTKPPDDARVAFHEMLEVRVHCPPERWEYNSPGGGSKNNAFFPSAVIEFRSRWS